MKDTPKHILQKQLEIIRSKPIEKRVEMTFEMINLPLDMAKARIKRQNPEMTDRQVIVQRFKELYHKDFSPEELQRIVEHLEGVKAT